MTRGTIRGWYLVHKWTSLISTVFLLMLCITGLPLIFHEEIETLTGDHTEIAGPPSNGNAPGLLPLDTVVSRALATRPGEVPVYVAFDNHGPLMTVTTAPHATSPYTEMTVLSLDRRTGRLAAAPDNGGGVMSVILRLHTDMFAGLPGLLFLGFMGLLFTAALVSGTVLYAPFMRKLDFGTLRTTRSTRLKWLDWHNLLGIVALAWMTVVGLTGVVNTLATPILQLWQSRELAEMTRAYAGLPALPPSRYGSLDVAMHAAQAARPGNAPLFIAFPGGTYSSRHHYAVFLQGTTPLTERLLIPALVDARTGRLTDVRALPWYAQALLVSQPLHFGDYGGMPMKILWAVLDLFTIVVLGSGVYLWLGRRRAPLDQRVREVETGGRAAPVAAE